MNLQGGHHGQGLVGGVRPVSYTHLDVYKRQVNILRARAAKNPKAKAAVARMDEELSKLFTVERSRGDSHEDDVRTVSYTHLDVYKRQVEVNGGAA